MSKLLQQHCRALEGGAPMTQAEVRRHLADADASGWQLAGGAIERTFSFKDFYETIAFVNALAWICNREDHHPELAVSFNRCTVRFNTHSVGGISINDFICAAKVGALVAIDA